MVGSRTFEHPKQQIMVRNIESVCPANSYTKVGLAAPAITVFTMSQIPTEKTIGITI